LKRAIDTIQGPIIGVAKHKLGIARTISNSVIIHRNLGNCNALWDQLLIKQITSLYARINSAGPEEKLTRIRINQGLLLLGATETNWQENSAKICNNLWKNNLACQLMLRAKELRISFDFNNIDIKKTEEKLKIANILEDKFTLQVALAVKKLNISSINQLINKEGNRMISWQQLKLLRKKLSKGRPAKWFKRIEETMLEDKSSRQLKPEFILAEGNNELSLQTTLDRCSNDNRRKE
jgi:hypothetical protein